MKERFLNLFLFFISLIFITAGVLMIFFNEIQFLTIIIDKLYNIFKDANMTKLFLEIMGAFLISWGAFFFLMTIYTVMELKHSVIYAFIFWVFTIWSLGIGYVLFKHEYHLLLIGLGVIYGIIFLPFVLSIPMKSSKKEQ